MLWATKGHSFYVVHKHLVVLYSCNTVGTSFIYLGLLVRAVVSSLGHQNHSGNFQVNSASCLITQMAPFQPASCLIIQIPSQHGMNGWEDDRVATTNMVRGVTLYWTTDPYQDLLWDFTYQILDINQHIQLSPLHQTSHAYPLPNPRAACLSCEFQGSLWAASGSRGKFIHSPN